MPELQKNVLLVGGEFRAAITLITHLQKWGFNCHFASALQAASALLGFQPVDVVLSERLLPDGTVGQLIEALSDHLVSAYIRVRVEKGCLWLPVLDCGRNCYGARALRPEEFARELQALGQQRPLVATRSS